MRPEAKKFENQEINEMVTMCVIEPFQAKLANLIVFFPKKDGTIPVWVYYQNVDTVMSWDSYQYCAQTNVSTWWLKSNFDIGCQLWIIENRDSRRRSR